MPAFVDSGEIWHVLEEKRTGAKFGCEPQKMEDQIRAVILAASALADDTKGLAGRSSN